MIFLRLMAMSTISLHVVAENNDRKQSMQASDGNHPREFKDEFLTSGLPWIEGVKQEISDVQDGYVSAPGCPPSLHGYPWVKYEDLGRCYLVGARGPCSEGTKVGFRQNVSHPGYCKCDSCHDNPSDVDERFCHKWDENQRSFTTSFAYYKEGNKCYELFKRGPCGKGHIFSLQHDSDTTPSCTENICDGNGTMSNNESTVRVFDPAISECVTIGGSCLIPQVQPVGTYQFSWDSIVPVCRLKAVPSVLGGSLGTTECLLPKVYSRPLRRCITPLRSSSTVG